MTQTTFFLFFSIPWKLKSKPAFLGCCRSLSLLTCPAIGVNGTSVGVVAAGSAIISFFFFFTNGERDGKSWLFLKENSLFFFLFSGTLFWIIF